METQLATTVFDFIGKDHFAPSVTREMAKTLFQRSVQMVELEVFSYCNRKCWFCPNSSIDRRSENLYMAPELYESILSELAEIGYDKTISYSRYNEPLADEIIIERIRQAHSALPNAFLHTNTNGDYLTSDYLEQLYVSGLRGLNIQVYLGNKDPYDHERVRTKKEKIIRKLGLPSTLVRDEEDVWLESTLEYRDMSIRIYGRNFEVNGCNRGKEVPIPFKEPRTSPCLSPFYHFYVDFNGSVMPCCNLRSDSPQHKDAVIADLNAQRGIFTAFASENAARWRRSLISFGEKQGVCKTCRFVEYEASPVHVAKTSELSALARDCMD